MAQALTIHELAARCDQALARAQRLFELVGAWSGTASDPMARIVLARVTTHAASHVEWWAQRMPTVAGLEVPPSSDTDGTAHWTAALTAVSAEGPTPLGLQGVAELVGRWIEEYADWVARHDPDLDAPTVRVLELVLGDLRRDRDDLLAVSEKPCHTPS